MSKKGKVANIIFELLKQNEDGLLLTEIKELANISHRSIAMYHLKELMLCNKIVKLNLVYVLNDENIIYKKELEILDSLENEKRRYEGIIKNIERKIEIIRNKSYKIAEARNNDT